MWVWTGFEPLKFVPFGGSLQTKLANSRARPFVVAVNAVVSVVLFDQNLDQKIDLGWPGLAWVKPWAGPASPGLGPGQALGKLAHLSFFRQVASKRCIFEQF